ncbi:MAG: hypothetical protein ACRC33_07480, partial [Gemmataceae bacterium]
MTFLIAGTAGADTITLVSFDGGTGDLTFDVNGSTSTLTGVTATDDVLVRADAGDDALLVGAAWGYDLPVAYEGQSGTDALFANGLSSTFSLTGTDAGTLLASGGTSPVAYSFVESLTGGAAADAFVVGASGSILSVAGGGGTDTLSYAGFGSAVTVNLQAATATVHSPADEVQELTVTPSGSDTFTLTFEGQTTAPLPDTATAAQVQTALSALSNIGGVGGSVVVTAVAGPPNVYTITFQGTLAGANVGPITAAFTGGASGGTATLTDGGPRVASFASIEALVGGTGSDAIIGQNLTTAWTLSGA